MQETHTRSMAKAVSWRVTGSLSTSLFIFIVTGSLKSAFSIGIFDFFVKFMLYYLHERVWLKIPLGLKEYGPEYEI